MICCSKKICKYLLPATLAFCLAAAISEARPKLDVVYLENGDRFTGEIKILEKGILKLNTDSAGMIDIDWLDVARVESPQLFEIETSAGVRYFGTIGTLSGEQKLMVVGGMSELALRFGSVVRIGQFDEGFVDRLSFEAESGFSFAKANSQMQLALAAEGAYRTRNYLGGVRYDGQMYSRSDTSRNFRNNLNLFVNRYFKQKWYATFVSNFQQNDELSLELRTLYGGGLGRWFYRSNRMTFNMVAGAAYTWEKFLERDAKSNMEAVLGTHFSAFQYSSPELDFAVDFTAYPSLTTSGRIRLELDTRLRYEIFKDLFIGFGFYNNFDSKPPSEIAERNDFGIRTTIGWTFN